MELLDESENRRILVIDDNEDIHADFRKILMPPSSQGSQAFKALAAELFDETPDEEAPVVEFEIDSAHQGQEGFERVKRARESGRPYAMAFVDGRMPPGWNGIETISHIWGCDDEIEIVLSTAYSDFSWEEISRRLPQPDRLLILKKPFDNIEVRQLAHCLTAKWRLRRNVARRLHELERGGPQLPSAGR